MFNERSQRAVANGRGFFVRQFAENPTYSDFRYVSNGLFGAVYRGHDRAGRVVAAKVSLEACNSSRRGFQSEIDLLIKCTHPDIVKIFYYELSGFQRFYLMEFAEGGNLEERFRAGRASEGCTRHIFKQVVAALSYIHRLNVVHFDVKPANILLMTTDELPLAKLTDFGLSFTLIEDSFPLYYQMWPYSSARDKPKLVAPEKLIALFYASTTCNAKVDVYDLGLTLLQVSSHLELFSRSATAEEVWTAKFIGEGLQSLQRGKSAEFLLFLYSCLEVRPEDRPSADQLLLHSWFGDGVGDGVTG